MLVRDGSLSPIYRRPKRHILSVHKACMKDFSDHCVDSFVLPSPASTPRSLARALGFAELNPQYSALSIYRYIKRQSWLNASGTIAAESLLLIRTWVLLWRVLACPIGLAAVYSNVLSNSHSHEYCPGVHSREWRCWCHSLAINEMSIQSIVSSAAYTP